MTLRLCSYDRLAVPADCFGLKDEIGEMYFCNRRCLAVWSVMRATKPDLAEEEKTGALALRTPSGAELQFTGLVETARWAALHALGGHS